MGTVLRQSRSLLGYCTVRDSVVEVAPPMMDVMVCCRARRVAVGMPVTRHAPHRSVLALLTHTVLTWMCCHAQRSSGYGSAGRTRPAAGPALPARCPARVRLFRVLLGQRPSLHDLLRPSPACVRPLRGCRVGGGALARWPPSAAQTVRAVFPHTAFTKTHASGMQSKGSTESSSPARTRRTAWFPATVASRRSATA
jgi:hypothetical protein